MENALLRSLHKKHPWLPQDTVTLERSDPGLKRKAQTELDLSELRVAHIKRLIRPHAKKCIDRIIELDKSDVKYKKMLTQSIAPGNKIEGTMFDAREAGRAVEKLMELAEVSNA